MNTILKIWGVPHKGNLPSWKIVFFKFFFIALTVQISKFWQYTCVCWLRKEIIYTIWQGWNAWDLCSNLAVNCLAGVFDIPRLHFIHSFKKTKLITLIMSKWQSSSPSTSWLFREALEICVDKEKCASKGKKKNSGLAYTGVKTSKPVAVHLLGSPCLCRSF